MTDLVTFLRSRLNEDEQAARAAMWDDWYDNRWTAYHREKYDGRWAIIDQADEGVITTVDPQAADDAGVAQHIARHDPARVLREVEAKRELLNDYERFVRERRRMMGGWDSYPEPSPVLLAFAAVYADHPDYQDTWRP
ncbi:DUF6221 family protein [Streptomyces halstedii]|uniref:DUF6221 family protein n=1 Tax=Streptomyces halstedii TaxID=1944 RepID=UPI0038191967